jgi:hypothetical protein
MEIIGRIEIKGFLRVQDLEDGEVFAYLDDNKPFMYGRGEYDDFIINLSTGEVTNDSDAILSDRPIRILKAKLLIED